MYKLITVNGNHKRALLNAMAKSSAVVRDLRLQLAVDEDPVAFNGVGSDANDDEPCEWW
jgi:hypothetical protein